MTTLQAARDFGATKKRAADGAPERHAAKKPKKSISVAGLFAKKPRTARENLQSSDGTSRKRLSVEDELTARAKRHPIYLDVKEAITVYEKDDTCSVAEELDATHGELTARIDNISINSKPSDRHGTTRGPAAQDTEDNSALFRSLSEDVLTVSIKQPDGSTARKNVKLGDSMQKMTKLIDDTEAKVAQLKDELDEVSEDISSVLEEYNKATKMVCKLHEGKRAVFLADVHAFHKSAIDNVVEASMDDKKQSVEANRKLQAFAASLI